MVDVLFVSLPSAWGRQYVYVENYWMILIAQYLASYGYNVATLDVALNRNKLVDVQKYYLQKRPKILAYLVSKKNWEIVYQVKENVLADINLLIWDESVVLNEVSNFIPGDGRTFNISLNQLFESIHAILPAPRSYCLYTEEILLIGRECLTEVLLNGGECEIVMQMPSQKCFPSDYVFDKDYLPFKKNTEKVRNEIVTLCHKYNLRKINIINVDFFQHINEIEKLTICLDKNNLSYVRLGIYISADKLTDKLCEYLIGKRNSIYKVTLLGNTVTPDQICKSRILQENGIKVKVMFELFHKQATIDTVKLAINAIREGYIRIAPTVLISGDPLNEKLMQILRIMRLLFRTLFLQYHQKIIEFENVKKYELRVGKSQQYTIIPEIQNKVDLLSQSLNDIFLSMIEDLISYLTIESDVPVEMVAELLNKYEEKIRIIGDDIDACLFNSYSVQ